MLYKVLTMIAMLAGAAGMPLETRLALIEAKAKPGGELTVGELKQLLAEKTGVDEEDVNIRGVDEADVDEQARATRRRA